MTESSVNCFREKLISQKAFWLGDSEISFDISQSNCSNLRNQFWEIPNDSALCFKPSTEAVIF